MQGRKLVINVDVANSCFWHTTSILQLAFQLSGQGNWQVFEQWMVKSFETKNSNAPIMWKFLKRLSKNKICVKHGQQTDGKKVYCPLSERLN